MESAQNEFTPLAERELDRIFGGRSCEQGGTRTEVKVPFGDSTLVIYAYSGTNGNPGCSGAYYQK